MARDPTPPSQTGALDVALVVINDWGNGAIVELEVTNPSATEAINGWDIRFNFEPGIQGIWNGDVADNDDGSITISNKDWNGWIEPGQTRSPRPANRRVACAPGS